MAVFKKKYALTIDKPCDEVVAIFESRLDDMTKKGYSLSGNTLIRNADHGMNFFSGEKRGDKYVVRQTENGTDDHYYRLMPRHEISFVPNGDKTTVNVSSKCTFGLVMYFVFLFVFILTTAVAISYIMDYGTNATPIVFVLIPGLGMVLSALLSVRSISNTKATLNYIFR